jgi:thioredoxin-like negative regulator of GroEL
MFTRPEVIDNGVFHHSPPIKATPLMSRREKIEAMLADDPNDTFLRYSLAMELRSEGNHAASLERLSELTDDDPPYVPAFFMAAQQLAELDRSDEARSLLDEGIKQAEAQGDGHAAAEMSDFLLSLGDGEL